MRYKPVHAWLYYLCLKKTNVRVFFDSCFLPVRFLAIHPTAKVSEGTNRNLPARNTLAQLLALYTDPESHNAQRHRRTDGQQDDANSRLYTV